MFSRKAFVMKKKKETWKKFRHKVTIEIIRPVFTVIASLKYHAKVDRFREEGKRNWLILSNHQTDFDQFFVGLAFRQPIYYVAMEDLFSNGFISKVIKWLVAPIPIMKASTDIRAMLNCIKIAREGGTIALFPEGNRTYSGKTCHIKPSVVSLAKKLGLPIALFRIEGGYGIKPRWSDKTRRGKMKAGVRRVIEPAEYADMSNDELYDLICRELYVDDNKSGESFISKKSAEKLERAIYICPDCGFSEFETEKDVISCKKCGKQYRLLPDLKLEGIGFKSSFDTVADWYDHQETFIRKCDLSSFAGTPLYCDSADISEVIVYDRKHVLYKNHPVSLYSDKLVFGNEDNEVTLDYDEIKAMACIAGHKLNIFYKDTIFQLKGGKSFNALKYCNIYYHAKFTKEEHTDGEFQFLGL